MRKCFIVSYNGISNVGGVERVCHYVYEMMKRKEYDVVIIDKHIVESYWLGRLLRKVVGKVSVLASSLLASLYVFENKYKEDIVITNGFNCPYVHADLLFVHGTMQGYSMAMGYKTTWRTRIPWLFERAAIRRARAIVAVSNNAIREVKKFYFAKLSNYVVVNNMVDEDRFFIKEHLETNNPLTIIFCGRLEPNKGVYRLCELCEFIDNNNLDARIVIATNNASNKELFEKFKCVTVNIGLTIETLNDFYNQGDVMYFPSLYEGFEMVTLEALSAGVPVLGNNVGAVGELVERKEPGCEIIENFEPALVLQQLKNLAGHYSSYKEKNMLHGYYAKYYGKNAYVKKIEDVLNRITQ